MKTILVVDDDSRVRNIIRLIFEPVNYKVVDIQNGKDAAQKAIEIKPDIVLVDVSLPDKNGYEISREIKDSLILKNTPIILLAGLDQGLDKIKAKAAEAGADGLATKPIEPEEVREKVEFLIFPKKKRLKCFINSKTQRERSTPNLLQMMFSLLAAFIFTALILHDTFNVNPFEAIESGTHLTESADTAAVKTDYKPMPAYKIEKRKITPEKIIDDSMAKPGSSIETPAQLSRLNGNKVPKEESQAKKGSAVEETPEETVQSETEVATKLTAVSTTETQSYFNLTGEWKLIHKVEHTLYDPYKGMTIGYRVTLKQNGKNIMGKAEKWWEDGEKIPPTARSQILIVGTLDGRILTATFVEEGTLRITSGSLVWKVSPDGKELQGSFTSTAAGSSGISVGNKVL